jgi:hypothetical protein
VKYAPVPASNGSGNSLTKIPSSRHSGIASP